MINFWKKNNKTVYILGAGVAGLAAAKEIKKRKPHYKTVVFEAKKHAGGRAFSYYNKTLEKEVDNATHVVLGCNKNIQKLMRVCEFEPKLKFWDGFHKRAYKEWWKCADAIKVSIFNTPALNIPYRMLRNVFWKLFPFTYNKRKIHYSHDNLTENLIEPLLEYVDEINYAHNIEKIETKNKKIKSIIFDNGKKQEIEDNDLVISALDAYAYAKLFKGPKFEFEKIITLTFRTSQPLYLPDNARYFGIVNSIPHWIFKNYDVLSITISAANDLHISDEEIKQEAWAFISDMRKLKPAFMPPCQLFHHEKATIKQDAYNNSLRPKSAKTKYENLFIAGDWTVKDYPCCLETAVVSAKRAVKTAL